MDCGFPATTNALEFEPTAAFGENEEHPLVNVAGIVSTDSLIVVYDAGAPHLAFFTHDLKLLRYWGREGRGPAEFARTQMPVDGWLDIVGDTIMVFDGTNLHFFLLDKGDPRPLHVDLSLSDAAITLETSRIAWRSGSLIYGVGDSPSLPPRDPDLPAFEVLAQRGKKTETIAKVRLAKPPTHRGAPFYGPHESRPFWAIANQCVVLSDGYSPFVILAPLHDNRADTVRFELPRTFESAPLKNESEGLKGKIGINDWPAPSRPARVGGLAIDKNGSLWISAARRHASSVPIVVVSLASGHSTTINAPAFPKAFLSNGGFLAIVRDDLDRPILRRYDPQTTGLTRSEKVDPRGN